MFEWVMGVIVCVGLCAAASVPLLNRYTAPGCGAEITTTKLVAELAAETGLSGLYLLNTRAVSGGLLSARRQCVVDVAHIEALQPLERAHWLKVTYSTSIDRSTGEVTVLSHVAGPATPVFAAQAQL
jgi:hypothetical protein